MTILLITPIQNLLAVLFSDPSYGDIVGEDYIFAFLSFLTNLKLISKYTKIGFILERLNSFKMNSSILSWALLS